MCDKDRLAGLHDHDAFPSLPNTLARTFIKPAPPFTRPLNPFPSLRVSHLLPINTPIIRLEHHISLARNMQPRTLHLLHAIGPLILVRSHHFLHFLWRDGEAAAGCPDGVAFAVEDCGAV